MVRTGDYSLGKIYKIVSNETDEVYIGSTCQRLLCIRFGSHKVNYNSWKIGKYAYTTSFELLKYPDCKIVLLENYPCNDKYELEARERYWIENTLCVNMCIPTRSKKEWWDANRERMAERDKQYYEDNKEWINERNRMYYEKNKEAINIKNRQYYENNKDKIQETNKRWEKNNPDKVAEIKKRYIENNKERRALSLRQYCERNKDKINAKVECNICGLTICKSYLSKHQKTKKCMSFINIEHDNEPDRLYTSTTEET